MLLVKTILKAAAYGILWMTLFSIEVRGEKVFDHLSSWVESQTWLEHARESASAKWFQQDKSVKMEAKMF